MLFLHLLGMMHMAVNEAFNIIEARQPDLVLVANDLTKRPEFAMFADLTRMIGLKLRTLTDDARPYPPRQHRHEIVSMEDVRAAGGLGAVLAPDLAPHRPAVVRRPARVPGATSATAAPSSQGWKTVVIGSSTGGFEALLEVLSHFPADCPLTLIVQHIRGDFLPGLVDRLNRNCAASVGLAANGAALHRGEVRLAPGNETHLVLMPSGQRCRLLKQDPVSGHRPSVDALFGSAAALGPHTVAALLTGMGRDGAAGMAKIKKAGGWTIAQDEKTCVVYGMPRAAVELGAVEQQLPIQRIGPAILKAAHLKSAQTA